MLSSFASPLEFQCFLIKNIYFCFIESFSQLSRILVKGLFFIFNRRYLLEMEEDVRAVNYLCRRKKTKNSKGLKDLGWNLHILNHLGNLERIGRGKLDPFDLLILEWGMLLHSLIWKWMFYQIRIVELMLYLFEVI